MSYIIETKQLLVRIRKIAELRELLGLRLQSVSFVSLHACVLIFISSISVTSQTVAFLTPDRAEANVAFADELRDSLDTRLKVLDNSLAETAYLSVSPATPFNLTTEDSKRIGTVIGCDFFILIRSATQRRSAFQRAEYYEAYSAIYVVSARTGRLVYWNLRQFEAAKPEAAKELLNESVVALAAEIESNLRSAMTSEQRQTPIPKIEEVPDDNSPESKNFKAPIPYRRIKPEYTAQAALYNVRATVDIMVDTSASGAVLRTEIVRWAGFGLDESVDKTVRAMNWRPAERNGRTLPMRFLVRYNFKKID